MGGKSPVSIILTETPVFKLPDESPVSRLPSESPISKQTDSSNSRGDYTIAVKKPTFTANPNVIDLNYYDEIISEKSEEYYQTSKMSSQIKERA